MIFEQDTAILVDDVTQNVLSINGSENISIENATLGHLSPLTAYECHENVVDVRDSTNVRILACDVNGCHVRRITFNAFYLRGCTRRSCLRIS